MNNLRNSILAITLLILVNIGCKKDSTITNNTTTTTYQMTATLDGTAWQSKNIDGSNVPVKWKKVTSSSTPYYEIAGQKASSIETITLRINANTLALNTDYILNITDPNTVFVPTMYRGLTFFVGYTGGLSPTATSGKVRITSFDGTKMSGTFEMKLANLNASNNQWTYLTLTNGVFTDVTQ